MLVRPLTSIEWPFPHAHFCLKSECRTPLPIIVTSQSFAKPNPTVQRMTNYYKNWLAWGFWHAPVHHLAIFVACSSSWSWSWSWTRPTGVPAEGLGRGAEIRGVFVPKIQTQSPFIGQSGQFLAWLVGENILHTSPSTSPTTSSGTRKQEQEQKPLRHRKKWWTAILLYDTKLHQPLAGSNGLTFFWRLVVPFASTQSFLKPLLRRRPHRHTGDPSPCSSVPLLC